jgi:hypothetical protein
MVMVARLLPDTSALVTGSNDHRAAVHSLPDGRLCQTWSATVGRKFRAASASAAFSRGGSAGGGGAARDLHACVMNLLATRDGLALVTEDDKLYTATRDSADHDPPHFPDPPASPSQRPHPTTCSRHRVTARWEKPFLWMDKEARHLREEPTIGRVRAMQGLVLAGYRLRLRFNASGEFPHATPPTPPHTHAQFLHATTLPTLLPPEGRDHQG